MKFRLIVENDSTVLQLRPEDEHEAKLLGHAIKGGREFTAGATVTFSGHDSYGKVEQLNISLR